MERIFNTGETSEELKAKYNPEGSDLRKVQLRLLDMLLYIDKVCKEQNIDYRLDGGNVLGAIRHGGFIPWDDDVDIVLDIKDYKKLCGYFIEHPHPQYKLQNHETDPGYFSFWSVLRDTKSEYIQNDRIHNMRKFRGLQIDIFPMQRGLNPFFNKIASEFYGFRKKRLLGKHKLLTIIAYNCERYILHPFLNFLSIFCGKKDYYIHSYGTMFLSCRNIDILLPHKDLIFEGHVFPGPLNPEAFLSSLYKNYMDLPPADKRNHHKVQYKIWD